MKRDAMNPLCPCRKTGAWRSRDRAEERLAQLQAAPLSERRTYTPISVNQCPHGVWHLTSKPQKRWKKGKLSQKRRAR